MRRMARGRQTFVTREVVPLGDIRGGGRGAHSDAAGRAASHTNSSGGPDVMMDGMCLIPADFLDFV